MHRVGIRYKSFAVACLAACLCAQPAMTAMAATIVAGEGSASQSGPGGPGGPGTAAVQPWTKIGGQYFDDQGNVMSGVLERGISVSKWQGNIDWAQVAADDVSFALVRRVSFG